MKITCQPYEAPKNLNFIPSTTPLLQLRTPHKPPQWQSEYVPSPPMHFIFLSLSLPNPHNLTNPPKSQRSAASKIDWTHLTTSLSLKGTTAASLAAFKKRNDDARRRLAVLKSQPQSVDLAHYRQVLNNTAAVDEIDTFMKSWKPVTYDVGRQVKAIEAFEAQAVKSAEETRGVVEKE
ncbi:MAG: hypothetical protein L6R35_006685, partial [Caloplaca aegaea]